MIKKFDSLDEKSKNEVRNKLFRIVKRVIKNGGNDINVVDVFKIWKRETLFDEILDVLTKNKIRWQPPTKELLNKLDGFLDEVEKVINLTNEDKLKSAQCPECGQYMDRITAWVCKKCGQLKTENAWVPAGKRFVMEK